LETLLEAADLLRDRSVEFVLVGDGPDKRRLMELAQKRRLPNLRFMDPLPKAEIPLLLAAADAAVITLRRADAFGYAVSPNKLFDYMAAGKPVICAVPGAIARLVAEHGAGLAVEPEDPDALAEVVRCLLACGEAELKSMGLRGRQLVEQEFSREVLAQRLVQLVAE
jgi:glycosyltransferase involved in cell wall biosynthesis